MKYHDNRINETNLRERIEFERSVSIGTQNTTYDYNDEFWDPILTILIHSYIILVYPIFTFIFY